MRIIDSKIDLGKSFEYLKGAIERAEKTKEASYPMAYGMLLVAVEHHINECSVLGNTPANADDIPGNLFNQ